MPVSRWIDIVIQLPIQIYRQNDIWENDWNIPVMPQT